MGHDDTELSPLWTGEPRRGDENRPNRDYGPLLDIGFAVLISGVWVFALLGASLLLVQRLLQILHGEV